MAKLSSTQVIGKVSATLAATDPLDYVRNQEFGQALSGLAPLDHTHTASEITDFAAAVGELFTQLQDDPVLLKPQGGLLLGPEGLQVDPSAVSLPGHHHVLADLDDFGSGLSAAMAAQVQATDSLQWSGMAASVRLKPGGALQSDATGLGVDLGSGAAQAAAGNHTHSQLHDPLSLAESATLLLGLNAQQLSAEVQLASLGGLLVNSGLAVDFGTGHYQAARGDHTHEGLGSVLTVASTSSLALVLDVLADGHQALSGVVRCDPAPNSGRGRLDMGSAGLYVVLGATGDTAAAGNHGHGAATQNANGFMAAADKAKLDSISVQGGGSVYPGGTVNGGLAFAAGLDPALSFDTGAGYAYDFEVTSDGTWKWHSNGSEFLTYNPSSGLSVQAMLQCTGLEINGAQVVGARQGAIADAASAGSPAATASGYGFNSAPSFNSFIGNVNGAITQLNRILSALRAHGLIAT